MDKCCRTCRYFSGGLCYHPEMSSELDVWSEYVEPLFDMGDVIEAVEESDSVRCVEEEIVATVARVLKNKLPVEKMNFCPPDIREFYCSYYE